MEFDLLQISLIALLLAILIDFSLGEPRGLLHIAILTGKLSKNLEKAIGGKFRTTFRGFMVLFLTIIVIVFFYYFLFLGIYNVPFLFVFFLLLYAVILKSTFAFASMRDHILPIVRALETGDINGARIYLSHVVRRDVSKMDERLIISATIETVSEGITDSFVGSLFYYSIFGIIGAIFYRVVNTLDSTFGYRDSFNLKFGKASALMDTILNYIPARISAILIIASAYLLNYNNAKYSMRSMFFSLQSRNAAYSMCAVASQLNIKLEKKGYYIINKRGFDPKLGDLKKTLKLFYASFGLMIALITIPLTIIFGYYIYPYIFYIFPHTL